MSAATLQNIWRGILISVTCILAACATPPPSTEPADQQPAQDHVYHQRIELGGRLSVHYQQDNKDEALHGSFSWLQAPEQTQLTVLSPLGQTIADIRITPNASILRQAGKPEKSAPDPDALAAEALGWPLPLTGMRDWLQGFAVNIQGVRFIATQQTDTVHTADGWHIHYVTWQDDARRPGAKIPKRIDLERVTVQAGEVKIRIVIDNVRTQ